MLWCLGWAGARWILYFFFIYFFGGRSEVSPIKFATHVTCFWRTQPFSLFYLEDKSNSLHNDYSLSINICKLINFWFSSNSRSFILINYNKLSFLVSLITHLARYASIQNDFHCLKCFFLVLMFLSLYENITIINSYFISFICKQIQTKQIKYLSNWSC